MIILQNERAKIVVNKKLVGRIKCSTNYNRKNEMCKN